MKKKVLMLVLANARMRIQHIFILSFVLLALFPVASQAAPSPLLEIVILPLTLGRNNPVSTSGKYAGPLTIHVSGTGQVAGTQYNDAFYIYADGNGTPYSTPITWDSMLLINDAPAVPGSSPSYPQYQTSHAYAFNYTAPSPKQPLEFSIGDTYVIDNTGSYTIEIYKYTITPPSITFDPPAPAADQMVEATVKAYVEYADVELDASKHDSTVDGTLSATGEGYDAFGSYWTWTFTLTGLLQGTYKVNVTANAGTTTVLSKKLAVSAPTGISVTRVGGGVWYTDVPTNPAWDDTGYVQVAYAPIETGNQILISDSWDLTLIGTNLSQVTRAELRNGDGALLPEYTVDIAVDRVDRPRPHTDTKMYLTVEATYRFDDVDERAYPLPMLAQLYLNNVLVENYEIAEINPDTGELSHWGPCDDDDDPYNCSYIGLMPTFHHNGPSYGQCTWYGEYVARIEANLANAPHLDGAALSGDPNANGFPSANSVMFLYDANNKYFHTVYVDDCTGAVDPQDPNVTVYTLNLSDTNFDAHDGTIARFDTQMTVQQINGQAVITQRPQVRGAARIVVGNP